MKDSHAPRTLQPFLHRTVVCLAAPYFALSSDDGQLRGTGVDGFYGQDRRLLHTLRLLVDGQEPEPVSHTSRDAGETLFRAVRRYPDDPTPDPCLVVERRRAVGRPGVVECGDGIRLHNAGSRILRCSVSAEAVTDLADVATVKAGRSAGDVPCKPTENPTHGVQWTCPRDQSRVLLRAVYDDGGTEDRPEPRIVLDEERPGRAEFRWDVVLPPGAEWSVRLLVQGKTAMVAGYPVAPRQDAPWQPPEVRGHDRLAALLSRALTDLDALRLAESATAEGEREDQFLAAGCPWYLSLFGRDSIWAARMMLPLGTDLARGTLWALARRQGVRDDAFTEEAPGRILHELRAADTHHGGGMVLPARYYGSMDATPLFVVLLYEAWRWGLAEDEVRRLLPYARDAMAWVERTIGDDGLVRYAKGRSDGLVHQGWKDSTDAIRDAGGRHVEPPIALCEVQGYAYEAATALGAMLAALLPGEQAGERWERLGTRLRRAFHRHFWIEEPDGCRYVAIAVDADGRPVTGRASNMGHLLGSGILDDKDCYHVAAALVSDGMRTPWGIRTRSAKLAGFNANSYHGGSVWTHDCAIVVHGMAARGFTEEAAALLGGLLGAAGHFGHQLPELYVVYANPDGFQGPAPYPAACRPQAWAAASAVLLCSAMLGTEVDVPRRRLSVRPITPSLMGLESSYAVRGLKVGRHTVDVHVDREGRVEVTGIDDEDWEISVHEPCTK
ncbi:glycogen debranching N-terminal domain-containing protein [Streptomyces sp. NPDC051219]|uniref:glycogen debranching N-terminal domain-containing protein n=1 Tax=Streptomyces sp. NPDC051219 TaxID=3155283 RepID=UPI003415DBAC